jgi:hypothetical protein
VCLLAVIFVLAFFNSSWAEFSCFPGDSADTCCGADSGLYGYSWDLGCCDTLLVVPWVHTDTCFISCYMGNCDTTCINTPGKKFPRFVYVNLLVTHDSNTFWDDSPDWSQDSIAAFITPLLFWHQPVSGTNADSVIFPFNQANPLDPSSLNNKVTNAYMPMGRSMFRHFVDYRTGTPDTVYHNRMLQMVQNFKAAWNVYTDLVDPDYHASSGDSGHVFLGLAIIDQNCQRWWEGNKVLLATLTFQVYMPEDFDTAEICFDSVFWPPGSNFTFTRHDGKIYVPRHELPICFRLYDDTVEFTDVRWIEDFTEEEETRPTGFSVSQNYPNPFNPVTNFKFSLLQASHVKIEIFNILGQKVKTLVDKDMRAGIYLVDWDGMDERGVRASSGVYFYRIVAGEFSDIRKMVFLK